MYQTDDIIAAQATPPGKSAIAIVRMSGAGAMELLKRCLSSDVAEFPPRRATLTDFRDGEETLDRVVVIFYPGPGSYTGEDLVEVHCHGGEYIAGRVLEALCKTGARPAQAGEFTLRAFLNGRMDLTQAEAVADLIASDSRFAQRNALLQLQGGLSAHIRQIREILLNVLSEAEAELEFPEDEPYPLDYDGWRDKLRQAQEKVDALITRGRKGRAVREGFRVTIAGPPNSGKSTLLNALLGEERAIVHHQPGTTRDIVREAVEMGGVKALLSDTAGLREVAGEVESEGIRRAYQAMETADMVIYLFDLALGLNGEEEEFRQKGALLVGNKVDLSSGEGINCDLRISALKGWELERLQEIISSRALEGGVEGGIIANERHLELLGRGNECLRRAIAIAQDKGETELLALEIREGAQYLGNIIGEGVTDEVLERIFSRFCIGK